MRENMCLSISIPHYYYYLLDLEARQDLAASDDEMSARNVHLSSLLYLTTRF